MKLQIYQAFKNLSKYPGIRIYFGFLFLGGWDNFSAPYQNTLTFSLLALNFSITILIIIYNHNNVDFKYKSSYYFLLIFSYEISSSIKVSVSEYNNREMDSNKEWVGEKERERTCETERELRPLKENKYLCWQKLNKLMQK